jgi:hypothetical protein
VVSRSRSSERARSCRARKTAIPEEENSRRRAQERISVNRDVVSVSKSVVRLDRTVVPRHVGDGRERKSARCRFEGRDFSSCVRRPPEKVVVLLTRTVLASPRQTSFVRDDSKYVRRETSFVSTTSKFVSRERVDGSREALSVNRESGAGEGESIEGSDGVARSGNASLDGGERVGIVHGASMIGSVDVGSVAADDSDVISDIRIARFVPPDLTAARSPAPSPPSPRHPPAAAPRRSPRSRTPPPSVLRA